MGRRDDLYLETRSGDVYRRDADRWSRVTNLRAASRGPGVAWHTGQGAPEDAVGREGDLYLDLVSDAVFRKSFGWKADATSRPESARWTVGNRFPQSEDGVEGEYFLDMSGNTIHQKRGGLWREVERVSLGSGTWDWGRGLPAAGAGQSDNVYLDTATGRVYRKIEGWHALTKLGGAPPPPPPPEGGAPAAPAATAGSAFKLAAGPPHPSAGAVGDVHLDTTSGVLYQRRERGWQRAFAFGAPVPAEGSQPVTGDGANP